MAGSRPKFLDSEYFVDEPGNWHLKPGAPDDVVKEFQEFMDGDEAEEPQKPIRPPVV
ncbi:hypothetical protein ACF5W4_11155 [Bacillota bacterium Lsc_1132]